MGKMTVQRATAADVLEILHADSLAVFRRLGLPVQWAQLSMPADNKAPRIKVSVRPGSKVKVPSRLVFDLGGRSVQVPVETAEDYQTYSVQ